MELNVLSGKILMIPAVIAVGIVGTWVFRSNANDSKLSSLPPSRGEWSIFESVDRFEDDEYSCFVYSEVNPDVHVFDNDMGLFYAYIDAAPEIVNRIEDEVQSDKEDCRIQTKLKKRSDSCQIFYAPDRLRYEYLVDDGDVVSEEWSLFDGLTFVINKDEVSPSSIEYRVIMDTIRFGKGREEVIYKGAVLVPSPSDAWLQVTECKRRELASKGAGEQLNRSPLLP